jgi:hypothetical protein
VEWKSAETKNDGLKQIPARWLHIYYFEALNILFRFENSVRTFVYAILKNEFQDKWDQCSCSFAGGEPQSIKGIASKRISQAESFGYLGLDIRAPLMHLTSGELIELLTSEAYWPKFRPHFRGNKEIIKNKLLEIGTIRNALAHFRPIKADDIELIKQNSRHALLGVEQCLKNIFLQPIRVPTNTTADWYRAISTLGTAHISTTPFFSADETWVSVALTFKTPMLSKRRYGETYFSYKLAKLNSANVLLGHSVLRKHVTCLTETVSYPSLSKEYDITISKDLYFVFRKDVLENSHKEISEDFAAFLRTAAEECELLVQDNLARGKMMETADVTAYWSKPPDKEGRWIFGYEELRQVYKSNDPDEYWGQRIYASDIVSGVKRYPWMPEDISDEEFPY